MNTDDLRRLAEAHPDGPVPQLVKYARELERDLVVLSQRCVAVIEEVEHYKKAREAEDRALVDLFSGEPK